MIFIGITGGIGSGKSFVCSLFKEKKIPVFHADEIAKEISERPDVKRELVREFGTSILTDEKVIDRKKLASIVFAEHGKLQLLNSILHPKVFLEFDAWKQTLASSNRYGLAEAALLFESGMDEKLDYVLSVIANDELRINRVMKRDNVKSDVVLSRIKNQLQSQELIERSDFILQNNGTKEELKPRIDFFDVLFSSLTQRKELQ
ncbi:MAG: dephospho-CoA kinase [Ignavibacteriales bacterium]|nr:dephospho-CoA kinase [Ignavibacteriales bacterium]